MGSLRRVLFGLGLGVRFPRDVGHRCPAFCLCAPGHLEHSERQGNASRDDEKLPAPLYDTTGGHEVTYWARCVFYGRAVAQLWDDLDVKRSLIFVPLMALVLAGCSQTSDLEGEVATNLLNLAASTTDFEPALECKTQEGSYHEEIAEGEAIYAYNERGEVIGKGTLGAGERSDTDPESTDLDCLFPFRISNVKQDAEFVTLKVGHSESEPYSKDEVSEPFRWAVE